MYARKKTTVDDNPLFHPRLRRGGSSWPPGVRRGRHRAFIPCGYSTRVSDNGTHSVSSACAKCDAIPFSGSSGDAIVIAVLEDVACLAGPTANGRTVQHRLGDRRGRAAAGVGGSEGAEGGGEEEGFVFTPATTRSTRSQRPPRCRPCPPVPVPSLALTLAAGRSARCRWMSPRPKTRVR